MTESRLQHLIIGFLKDKGADVIKGLNDAANGAQALNNEISDLTVAFGGATLTNSGNGIYNVRDWVDAQLALVDTDMVKLEEVFLPYMLNAQGQTLFEVMEKSQFLLPEARQ